MIRYKALRTLRPLVGGPTEAMAARKTVVDKRTAHALEAFAKAVKALGKKDFDRALALFDSLIEAHPEERDLVERARSYRAICERALEKRRPRPKSFEDLLNHGVYLHNRGDYAEALKTFQHAAEIHPKNEHVLYCIAAAQARTGDVNAAIKALRSAIHANPANRAQARSDADFEALRENSDFAALVFA
jgi:tetratricopeptide (TPR) repeat protein